MPFSATPPKHCNKKFNHPSGSFKKDVQTTAAQSIF